MRSESKVLLGKVLVVVALVLLLAGAGAGIYLHCHKAIYAGSLGIACIFFLIGTAFYHTASKDLKR